MTSHADTQPTGYVDIDHWLDHDGGPELEATEGHGFEWASAPLEDDEEFCSECLAGVESSEHHQKCVVPEREATEGGDAMRWTGGERL